MEEDFMKTCQSMLYWLAMLGSVHCKDNLNFFMTFADSNFIIERMKKNSKKLLN